MTKIVNVLGTGEKQWGCEFLHYDFHSRNNGNKTNKQSNKQNLLALTVSCDKKVA